MQDMLPLHRFLFSGALAVNTSTVNKEEWQLVFGQ
jgi:hypothetical protein